MIDFRIEVGDAQAHRFTVTLRVAKPQAQQAFSLPVWIPGSYLVREFARHLSPIAAEQGGQARTVTPTGKASWLVDTEGSKPLTLRYEVYAFDTSVRAAFLDAQRGFFNGTSVFLKAEGFENQPQRVKITGLPKGWSVATALPAVKVNVLGLGDYEAPDYDALVDHPVELGTFWRGEFMAKGVRHEFVVAGAPADLDGQRLLDDSRQLCEAQIAFWHGRRKAPFDHYVFMLNAVDDGYGGLEHRQSTALICSRKDLPRLGRPVNKDAYTTLLGLISHEYFHTWNVKRLKPAAFAPYDYTQENHTRMLWFFEGFTSYYDDQFLLRTGLIDAGTYLKLLGKTVNQVLSTPGRQHYSVGQASFDAWTRYYRQDENTANATVSYYTKGSLVALALDLALRQLPQQGKHQPCLDGVMQRLWQLGRAITEADVALALADEAGALPPPAALSKPLQAGTTGETAWPDLLAQWTEGTADLPLEALLQGHAVGWTSTPGSLTQRLGVKFSEAGGMLKVQAVMRGSLGEQTGLSAGDECLALDGWRLKRSEDLQTWHQPERSQTLLVSRDGRVLTLSLPSLTSIAPAAGTVPPASGQIVTLSPIERGARPEQTGRRRAWLRH
jgi:predicted metalloprotease with PDZ domain